MNGQDYLNQIASQNRSTGPVAQDMWSKIKGSKYFKWGVGALVLLILIMIVGAFLGGGKKETLTDQISALQLRLMNTQEVIQEYQKEVKSTKLRSSSASLYAVMGTTRSSLLQRAGENFSAAATQEALANKDELTNELFSAKINGNLDRIYAHKMAYEISWITAKENSIIDATKDAELKEALLSSYASLENLYTNFADFSETK